MNDDLLRNEHLSVTLSAAGEMGSIAGSPSSQSHAIPADAAGVLTDAGATSPAGCVALERSVTTGSTRYLFRSPLGFDLFLAYELPPGRRHVERWIGITNIRRRITLLRVDFGETRFARSPEECVVYDTFWQCPTVAFLRWERAGLFMGIENPFFATAFEEGAVRQSFEPGIVLRPGDGWESEPQFIGAYASCGESLCDHYPWTTLGRRPRFFNPCGHVPLDREEVRAMQRFAADYLAVPTRRFHFIQYDFFYPLPRMPMAGSPGEAIHLKMIDTFRALGGDLALLNPMHPNAIPEGGPDAFWDLAPEGTGSAAVLRRAQESGIGCGYYMGSAFHGEGSAAAALPYAPDRPEWKKVDQTGVTAGENCMACDEYAEWLFRAQSNTISRLGLKMWDWDPGPGNGFFCHSDRHGHLPGKGGYKGWRNATALIGKIRRTHPGIYLQAFYGRKEYGLWGFRGFDQHESYWEVSPVFGGAQVSDLHADRANADQIRQQAQWNQTFRFHPSRVSHAMTHRQQEGHFDPRVTKAWDHLGWKYSLLSTLAACGSVLVTILPESADLVGGMREFYDRWLGWAREHYALAKRNIPFGEQMRPGCVDGWARLEDGHGFIFLCNPNPRPTRTSFGMDREIGLDADGRFELTERYPVAGRGRGSFEAGSRVSIVVPADEVLLLELRAAGPAHPGAAGRRAPAGREPLPPRTLDDWRFADGSRFLFPRHAAVKRLEIVTSFVADARIRLLLSAARPGNAAEVEELLPRWKRDYPEHFAWAQPDRLWLVLPFTDAGAVGDVELGINGSVVPVECYAIKPALESPLPGPRKIVHYADITDAVRWGVANVVKLRLADLPAGQFMGPYLDYPSDDPVAEALAADTAPVIYDGLPLDPDMPPRVRTGPDDRRSLPRVTSLRTVPECFREGETTRIVATVDMAAEDVAEVIVSGPSWADLPMQYDAASGVWFFDWKPPLRWQIIMDVPRHYAWAVAKNGLVGPRMSHEVLWRFPDRGATERSETKG